MAKNTGSNHRHGSVKDRSQFQHPNGHYVVRDTTTGQITNVISSGNPAKGVAKEPDARK